MFLYHWRNCEFRISCTTINSSTCSQLCSFSTLTVTSSSGRLNSSVWLLLFEVLREIISLCLVFFGICWTTLSADSIIVNYLCWRCLFDQEISFVNKFFAIKRTFHWLSSTQTPKVKTICMCGCMFILSWNFHVFKLL